MEFCCHIAQVVARRIIVIAVCAAALLCLQSKREFALSNPSNSGARDPASAGAGATGNVANSHVFVDPRAGNTSILLAPFAKGAEYQFPSNGIDPHREMEEIAFRYHGQLPKHNISHGAGGRLEAGTAEDDANQLEAEKPYLSEISKSHDGNWSLEVAQSDLDLRP